MFNVIDLDNLTDDAKGMKAVATALRAMALYADMKALAMEYRDKGDAERATGIENGSLCTIYKNLPEWAKW